jgi:hypothetical protein
MSVNSKNLPLPPIEEDSIPVPKSIKKHNKTKANKKGTGMIQFLLKEGKNIRESEGDCDSHYNRIKTGNTQ